MQREALLTADAQSFYAVLPMHPLPHRCLRATVPLRHSWQANAMLPQSLVTS